MLPCAFAGTLTGNHICQGELDSIRTKLSDGCSTPWLPFLRPIVLLFTIHGPVGADDMATETSGTPRMVLRPGLCLGLCPDQTPGVLRTVDTGQSPTPRGSLVPRHMASIAKVGITRSDLQSQFLLCI